MRTIIAGSREITNYGSVIDAVLNSGFEISEVVCGMAKGVDLLGKRWALDYGVPVKEFPADWKNLGIKAGYLRNEQMAGYAERLVAVWDGHSRGTKHMIDIAKREGLTIFIADENGDEFEEEL